MGFFDSAIKLAAVGLEWHPESAALQKVHKNASDKLGDVARLQILSNLSVTAPSETTRYAEISKDIVSFPAVLGLQVNFKSAADYLRKVVSSPESLRQSETRGGAFPDEYCRTFLDSQVLPAGCNPVVSFKLLYGGSYWACTKWLSLIRKIPYIYRANAMETSMQTSGGDPHDPIHASDAPYMEHHMAAQRRRHLSDVPQGSVKFTKRAEGRDVPNRLSFSDVPQHALPIPEQGMHVAVNFVDLGVLAETLIEHQRNEDYVSDRNTDSKGACMLKWVGVEQSSFACAKVLVIVQMMQRGSDAGNIVQVRSSQISFAIHMLHFSRRSSSYKCVCVHGVIA